MPEPERTSYRFPFPPFPSGWFRVADARDARADTVRALRYFGRDLVLTRGADGAPRLFDAHCPHLGAHLGVGGRLVDGTLQCPFHGWRFDGDGRCVSAPMTTRTPAARLGTWAAREWCGAILAYHGPENEAPSWEPPVVPESSSPEWTPLRPANRWVIRSHPQEFGENGMDLAHFPFLHSQQTDQIRTEEVAANGPLFLHRTFQRYTIFGLARLWVREVTGPLDVTLVGPGCAINRASVHAGRDLHYIYLFFFTPIDGEHVEMRSMITMRRLGSRPLEWALLRKAMSEGAKTIEQDIPIWENKRYRDRPHLSDADGPILTFRRWYRQFHAPADATGAVREGPGPGPGATADTPGNGHGTSGDAKAPAAPGCTR